MAELREIKRYPHLDGIRGIAALVVLVHHFFQPIPPTASRSLLLFGRLTSYGFLGVDVFFVLSGFLISLVLLVDLPQHAYFHDFYWKRALRILPVFVLHLVFAEIFVGHATGYIVLSLLFLGNFDTFFHVAPAGLAWTLSIEEQFYLVWPQIVRRVSVETLMRVALWIVALCTLLRIAVSFWHGGFVRGNTIYRVDGLCLGAVLACETFSSEARSRYVRRAITTVHSNWTLFAVAAVLLLLSFYSNSGVVLSVQYTFVNLLTYRVIRYVVCGEEGTRLDFLAWPVLRYIGAISYAMYLFHPYVFSLASRLLGEPNFGSVASLAPRLLEVLTLTVVLCAISRHFVELPVQRLRRFVLNAKSGNEIAPSKSLASDLGG